MKAVQTFVLCLITTVSVAGAQGLRAIADGLDELPAYEWTWREPIRGWSVEMIPEAKNVPPEALRELGIEPYVDEVSGEQYSIVRSGRVVRDGDRVRIEGWWLTVRGPEGHGRQVDIWTESEWVEVSRVPALEGVLHRLDEGPDWSEPKQLERGIQPYARTRAMSGGYYELLEYLTHIFSLADDVQTTETGEGTAYASESWMARAVFDEQTLRLVEAELYTSHGIRRVFRPRGWYEHSGFPLDPPRELRRTTYKADERLGTIIHLLDRPRRLASVDESLFEWREMAKSVRDPSRKQILARDGSTEPIVEQTESFQFHEPVTASNPHPGPAERTSTTRRAVMIASLVLLIGGVLLWIRRRVST